MNNDEKLAAAQENTSHEHGFDHLMVREHESQVCDIIVNVTSGEIARCVTSGSITCYTWLWVLHVVELLERSMRDADCSKHTGDLMNKRHDMRIHNILCIGILHLLLDDSSQACSPCQSTLAPARTYYFLLSTVTTSTCSLVDRSPDSWTASLLRGVSDLEKEHKRECVMVLA